MRRRLPLAVSILLVLSIVVMPYPVANSDILRLASTGPVLYVNPTSVPIEGTVYLSGSGFNATEIPGGNCWAPMQFNPPGLVVPTGTCTVDGSGVLSGSFVVGTGTIPQVYTASLPSQGVSASFVVYSVMTASTTTTTTTTTTSTTTSTTASVSVPSISVTPSYALSGSSASVTVAGVNFVGTTCALYPGLAGVGPPSCSISSGTLSGGFSVNPSAAANLYTLVVQTNAGEQASCPFVILPSATRTVTSYNITVTRTSISFSNWTSTIPVTAFSWTTSFISVTSSVYNSTVTTVSVSTVIGWVTSLSTTSALVYLTSIIPLTTGTSTVRETMTNTTWKTIPVTTGTETSVTVTTQRVKITETATTTTISTSIILTEQPVQQQSSNGPDVWTIAGIVVLIAIGLAAGVMGLLWWRRRGKPSGKAGEMGKIPGRALSAATSSVLAVAVEKKEKGHVATAAMADDGSISCKSCGARIQKGNANCQICGTSRKFSEQEETPEHQEGKLKKIQQVTEAAEMKKKESTVGPLKEEKK